MSKCLKIFPLCCCPVAESSLQYYRSSDFCRQNTVEKGSVSCFCIENNSINTFNIDSSYIWLLGPVTCNCKCFSGYLVVYLSLLLERFFRLWLRPSGLYPTDSVSVVSIISWFHLSLQSIRSSKQPFSPLFSSQVQPAILQCQLTFPHLLPPLSHCTALEIRRINSDLSLSSPPHPFPSHLFG